jgi:O-methyltransferase involved in polyketide biosynthesis
MGSEKVALKGVQETLLMPLWGRAVETRSEKPRLVDHEAVRMIESIDYDFTQIADKINPLSRASWIARSLYFDQKINEYLGNHPDGTVINIGCGLDTTYERVNNGKAAWYELDFPEVIAVRKSFIQESSRRKLLPHSVFDETWYSEIGNKEDVLVMMAGVIYYFEESQVRKLLETFKREFQKSTLICDYSSSRGVRIANKKVIDEGGMDQSAYLKWGIDDIIEIEKWDSGIRVEENMKMFSDHRKRYPPTKRLGMWISDAFAVMSLAKITIQ